MTKNILEGPIQVSKEVPQLPITLLAYETSNQAPLKELPEKRDFTTSNDTKAYQTSLPPTAKPAHGQSHCKCKKSNG